MTPAQALTTVRYQIAEPASSSTNFFSSDEIRAYLWEGEVELNNELGSYRATTAFTTTTGTQEYTYPVNYIRLERIKYNQVPLKHIDYRDMDALDFPGYGGTLTTGDPTHFYVYADKIGLWPVPDTSASVNVYGIKEPASITSDASNFSISQELTKYLPDYALYRCYLKDQDNGRAQAHLAIWEKAKREAQYSNIMRKYQEKLPVVRDEDNYATAELGLI